MQAFLFPFTTASDADLHLLTACFHPLIAYRPAADAPGARIKRWVDSDRVALRAPVTTDQQKLLAVANEYQTWAQSHPSTHLSELQLHLQNTPFFDEDAASRIRSQILGGDEPPVQNEVDPLWTARLFLSIAHRHDRDHIDVAAGLSHCRSLETQMLEGLTAAEKQHLAPTPLDAALAADDIGATMTTARIQSWNMLADCDPDHPSDDAAAVLVTTSRAVFAEMVETMAVAGSVKHWETSKDQAGKRFAALAAAPVDQWDALFAVAPENDPSDILVDLVSIDGDAWAQRMHPGNRPCGRRILALLSSATV